MEGLDNQCPITLALDYIKVTEEQVETLFMVEVVQVVPMDRVQLELREKLMVVAEVVLVETALFLPHLEAGVVPIVNHFLMRLQQLILMQSALVEQVELSGRPAEQVELDMAAVL